jgi:hypothetical protein
VSTIDEARAAARYDMTDDGLPWYVTDADRYAHAQALATIALAEEQRTANLIAYLAISDSRTMLDLNLMRDEIEHRLQSPSAPTTTSRASG